MGIAWGDARIQRTVVYTSMVCARLLTTRDRREIEKTLFKHTSLVPGKRVGIVTDILPISPFSSLVTVVLSPLPPLYKSSIILPFY